MQLPVRITATTLLALLSVGCGLGNDDVRSSPKTNEGTTSAPTKSDDNVVTSGTIAATSTTAKKTTTTEAKPAPPALARASEFVGGNVDPAFGPGETGKLSVVAVGSPDGERESIEFVVRNNTSGPLYGVSATGKVTSAGKLVGSGESQSVQPAVVAPGEIAFGYVYFSAAPPAGSTIEVSATADSKQDDLFREVPLIIGEANPVAGEYSNQVVGEVTAPADVAVSNPAEITVVCVDAVGKLSAHGTDYTDGDASILPGTSATYSVDISGQCPTFLVGASGSEET